jgi:hypothetical protein
MRPFRMRKPFQHVFLLRPYETLSLGGSRWLYVEWSFMGAVTVLLDEAGVKPLHDRVIAEGAMLHWRGSDSLPPPHMGNGLWPLTCVTFVRQVLGLPFRYRTWTPLALWNELVDRGARIVMEPCYESPTAENAR